MAGGMQPKPAAGDGYLVARAQEGYLDAYEMLVQRHSAMAYRVAPRLCGSHHDAQDIAQEALIAAWENLARFRAGSSFSTWLYRIVTRRALNKVTRGRGADLVDLQEEAADPQCRAHGASRAQPRRRRGHRRPRRAAVRPARRSRPAPPLSYAEVAVVTRSTVPAVRSHLHPARCTLGAKLQEWR
jgi:RNA polymerase sigma-70 factor, ECF subfamily